jgi:hypothetical protein
MNDEETNIEGGSQSVEQACLVTVTNHSRKRFKQRLGLSKKACQRHAEIAFLQGATHADVRGRAKRYLDRLFLQHHTANQLRVHGQFVYLFNNNVLITVLGLPKSMRGGCSKR